MHHEQTTPTRISKGKLVAFVVIQACLLVAVAGAAAYRSGQLQSERQLPPLLEKPREVLPEYDYEVVISDEQIHRVLRKLRPILDGEKTSLGRLDHNLRCWSAEAKFDEPGFVSGEEMRGIVTDHGKYAALYGAEESPLLVDVPDAGVRVRDFDGPRSSPHNDHTMATLAEIGTPLDFPLITPNRQTTFRSMVEQSLRDFNLNQVEYEWSAITYALLLDTDHWTTTEGRHVNFDMLADRIMREEMPSGVCMGNHRLFALVLLLRVDDQKSILSASMRREILDYLAEQTSLLVQHQHAYGFWNGDWPNSTPPGVEATEVVGDRLSDRLIATGHALEWWALAPTEVHPPRATLAAAGQWLVTTIDGLTPEQVQENASFLSHVGRALALWRGKLPHQIDVSE